MNVVNVILKMLTPHMINKSTGTFLKSFVPLVKGSTPPKLTFALGDSAIVTVPFGVKVSDGKIYAPAAFAVMIVFPIVKASASEFNWKNDTTHLELIVELAVERVLEAEGDGEDEDVGAELVEEELVAAPVVTAAAAVTLETNLVLDTVKFEIWI
ncbi:hypothetical protein MMC12_002813 [Toensbergia leucococca]|nr:hypothetical protein [Toensbergia leucococca]